MDKPDLRRHQRILVPAGYNMRATANGGGARLEGTVSVIGLGGMFIRTKNTYSFGTVLHLQLDDPSDSFEAKCTVRHVAENGVGVEITEISDANEQRLRNLLLRLKA